MRGSRARSNGDIGTHRQERKDGTTSGAERKVRGGAGAGPDRPADSVNICGAIRVYMEAGPDGWAILWARGDRFASDRGAA